MELQFQSLIALPSPCVMFRSRLRWKKQQWWTCWVPYDRLHPKNEITCIHQSFDELEILKTVRYDWARFVPRPQAHSVGKVYAGLGHPNTFLWSTCSEQRQTAVLHRFNFCMFCSKNSWTCVKQQGNQGSIVTHSKNLKDMFLRMFIHLHIHIVMLHIITR